MAEESREKGYSLEEAADEANLMKDLVGGRGKTADYKLAHDLVGKKTGFESRVVDQRIAHNLFVKVLAKYNLANTFNGSWTSGSFSKDRLLESIRYASWVLVVRDLDLDDRFAEYDQMLEERAKKIGWGDDEIHKRYVKNYEMLIGESQEAISILDEVWKKSIEDFDKKV